MSAGLLGRQVFFRFSFTLRHVPAHLLHDLSGKAGIYTGKACTNLRHAAVSVGASLLTPNVVVAGHYGSHLLRKSAGGHGLQMWDREVRLYPCKPAKTKRESCVLVLRLFGGHAPFSLRDGSAALSGRSQWPQGGAAASASPALVFSRSAR